MMSFLKDLCVNKKNKMITEQEIKKDLDRIADILSYSRHLVVDSYHMLHTETSEKFSTISRNKFLVRVRDSFWKLGVIELAKIYGKSPESDHYSLPLLISALRKQHKFSDWNAKISSDELKNLKHSIGTNQIKESIRKLLIVRNKHYAHTDKDHLGCFHDIKFHVENCFGLIEVAETIIETLSEKFSLQIKLPDYQGEQMNDFIDNFMELKKHHCRRPDNERIECLLKYWKSTNNKLENE